MPHKISIYFFCGKLMHPVNYFFPKNQHIDDDLYRTLYLDNNLPSTEPLDNVEHLLQLDIKPIFDKINKVNNKDKECFGLLPLMM